MEAACGSMLTCVCHYSYHIAGEQPQLLEACTAQSPSSWSASRGLVGNEVAEWQINADQQP